jgi:hypothetical protein
VSLKLYATKVREYAATTPAAAQADAIKTISRIVMAKGARYDLQSALQAVSEIDDVLLALDEADRWPGGAGPYTLVTLKG